MDSRPTVGATFPLHVGQEACVTRLIDKELLIRFAAISGDSNPIHLDESYARSTKFGTIIAPGLLVASFISAVIANELPGPGTVYLEQNLEFLRPVRLDDTVTATVTVTELEARNRVRLSTIVANGAGDTVIHGAARVIVGAL